MSIKGEPQQKKNTVFIFLCVLHQEALTLLDKVRHSNHCPERELQMGQA